MKKFVAILLFCLLPLSPLSAKDSPFYMSLKLGLLDAGGALTDSAINSAFDLGYRHNRYLSTEVEYCSTFVDGKTANGNDWQADSLSVFAALRTNTEVKLKGKIGLTNLDNDSGLNLSTGIGISYWAMGGLAEIEYTKIDDGISFFSFGINYFF